jgi:hypothetical protein
MSSQPATGSIRWARSSSRGRDCARHARHSALSSGAGRLGRSGGDRVPRQVEVRGQRVERAVQRSGRVAENALPQHALLRRRRPGDVDARGAAAAEGDRLARRDDHRRVQSLDERRQTADDVGVRAVRHLDEKHVARQRELALPETSERRALVRLHGKVGCGGGMDVEAGVGRAAACDIASRVGVRPRDEHRRLSDRVARAACVRDARGRRRL